MFHQPDVRFVDEGRGLERLPGLLPGEPLRGQLAKLVVDQWEELAARLAIAPGHRAQDLRDLIHEGPHQSQAETGRKLRDRNPGSPPDIGIAFGGSDGERGQMPRLTPQ